MSPAGAPSSPALAPRAIASARFGRQHYLGLLGVPAEVQVQFGALLGDPQALVDVGQHKQAGRVQQLDCLGR